ncbi:Glucan endo-1,3-beta-glucosidase, basic vacuolar isoform [Hibiscus syriacus]|uniref:glucan endo-1,3-beta-D-glucosidase n=1 Tax=Hibiscus syriacus TaxID=106335 RepID=A0A6A2WGY6_HIBSY|nr:Glucan endo-1,3-beta-glucosidase, basic vacuolar isoform [Hibiscus syriacus]
MQGPSSVRKRSSKSLKLAYVAVGNEIKPTDPEAQYVLAAMQNIYNALVSAQVSDQIKVSTSVEASLLGQSYRQPRTFMQGPSSVRKRSSKSLKLVYVAVGNEIKPIDPEAQYVLAEMQNIYNALVSAQVSDQIKVSMSVEASLLGQSYPPSAGSFGPVSSPYMTPIITFLATTGAPLLANVYPYFGYISDPQNVRLDYALFTAPGTVVQDGPLNYQKLFDAILDAFYSALEKAGGANVGIVVSETGWPSAGVEAATVGFITRM